MPADIVQSVRQKLYGMGVGEQAAIVQAASNANETISAPTVVFTLATNDGAKVRAGDILSTFGSATQATAFVFYIISVSTDTVTCIAQYNGGPLPTTDDMDDMIFEVNPTYTEQSLWDQVETIVDSFLWPDIWKYGTASITPNLATGEVELAATIEEIESAQQQIGDEWTPIPFAVEREVSTDISSTGVLGTFGAYDGSAVKLVTRERYLSSDTLSNALENCIATGAAALAVGANRAAASQEAASKDSQFRGERNPSDVLWRDFITLKQSIAGDIAAQVDWFEIRR